MRRITPSNTALMCAVALLTNTVPAMAGEVNGSTTNPKHYFAQGVSECKFSGLNDNPLSTDPANPGGRTQSFGQLVRYGFSPQNFNPGVGCNPTASFEEELQAAIDEAM